MLSLGRRFAAVWLALVAWGGAALGEGPAPVDYNRDVRPILAGTCFACHGPDDGHRKAGLRLDIREAAIRESDSGAVAIVPGTPGESDLIGRIDAPADDDRLMPPKSSHKTLTARDRDTLRRWIAEGAEYRPHWAFVAPKAPSPPSVRDESWPRNPIDRFVLERLDREGRKPSPEADRATLIRRLSLDLIGLPPTPPEIDAFEADAAPDAYEKVVDRLLASPHYGERWARRWLDRARYADTNGYEKDRERSIWPFRDWVIRALNDDLPFDRFTVDQLAGDLLPGATEAQRVATGFHRNTMINEEGGIDVEEFRFASVVDRVATTGTVWLGLTIQCAQCHTHKFDPITQREYYGVFAFFDNVDEPEMDLPTPDLSARRGRALAEVARLTAGRAARFPVPDPVADWSTLTPKSARSTAGSRMEIKPDGSVLVAPASPAGDVYEVVAETDLRLIESIRVEAIADPSLPAGGPGLAPNGNFVLGEVRVDAEPVAPGGNPARLTLDRPSADLSQADFDVSKSIDGDPKTGWAVDDGSGRIHRDHAATYRVADPGGPAGRRRISVRLDQNYGGGHAIGRFRLSIKGPARVPTAEERSARLAERLAEWSAATRPHRWSTLAPKSLGSAKGATLETLPDGSIQASGDKPNNDTYEVSLSTDLATVSALRLEALPDPSNPEGGSGRAPLFSVGDFLLTEIEGSVSTPAHPGESRPLAFGPATADYAGPGRSAAFAVDGKTDTGWSVAGRVDEPHSAVFSLSEPIATGPGSTIRLTFHQEGIHQMTLGRFRLSATADPGPIAASGVPADAEEILLVDAPRRSPAQAARLLDAFLTAAPEMRSINDEIASMRRSAPRFATTMVMRDRPPTHRRTTRMRERGEFLRPGEAVSPGVPGALPPLPAGVAADRLAMARWLVSGENPLVGRVAMNQAWQAFFGRGIVSTIDDFGTRGAEPSHPGLLDWLAVEFPRRGWSMKAMHRLIVTSATYRQSSDVDPAGLAADPRNELLSRGPRFRIDAEMVRDVALSASGLLNPEIGGPSVYPPQPDGSTALAYAGNGWPTSVGAARHRRGLYTFAKRTAPFAASTTFDAPGSEAACVRRERSNTPLQALTLMNDPVFV